MFFCVLSEYWKELRRDQEGIINIIQDRWENIPTISKEIDQLAKIQKGGLRFLNKETTNFMNDFIENLYDTQPIVFNILNK